MIPPGTSIPVTFTVEEWNAVFRILERAPIPHMEVDPVIRAIQRQCMVHDQPEPKQALAIVDNVTSFPEAGC